jgi:hypothetical protein
VTRYFAFNGDADGLFALQQLRLAEPGDATLITGVKRDISLLARVAAQLGDSCTTLDISLDVNRVALAGLLESGVHVRYFDHHFAGVVPEHPNLEAYLDPSPEVCTSLLVDRYLQGRFQLWAIAAAFGDNLPREAEGLAAQAGLAQPDVRALQELGICVNYNAYGEQVSDLRTPPARLAEQLLPYTDPREFIRSADYGVLLDGYREDMAQVGRLEPVERVPGALLYVLPDAGWARRASGTLANDLTKANPSTAVAILAPRAQGGFVVSVRVPSESAVAADAFCRRYKTGGGRRTAAGINELADADVAAFAREFAEQFRSSAAPGGGG